MLIFQIVIWEFLSQRNRVIFWVSDTRIMEKLMYVEYADESRGDEYYKAVNEGVNKYISKRQNVMEEIPEDEARNFNKHVEASYLCHGIWSRLMDNKSNNGNPYSDNYFAWSDNPNTCEEDKILFHFDIMNNPKVNKKNVYSCGLFRNCDKKLRTDVEHVYHTIGNMAPIPWFRVAGNRYINGQTLHKSLDERWDLFLHILRDNWDSWNTNKCNMTFEKYMKLSCQQIYYKEIYEDAIKKDIDKISREDISRWNKSIKPNSELLSFSCASDSSSNECVEMIKKLIEIRCQMIYVLLKEG